MRLWSIWPKQRRLFSPLEMLLVLGIISGCSVNGTGLLHQTRTVTNTAVVLNRQASGLHLELEPNRLGLTLGTFQGQYLYPLTCPQASPEIHSAELTYRHIIGAYFSVGRGGFEIGLGLRESTAILSLPPEANYGRRLVFAAEAPEHARIELLQPARCMKS